MEFILKSELEHFSKIAGTQYRKDNPQNRKDGEKLKTLINKLNYWAENSIIEELTCQLDYKWQLSGNFRSYLWIRFYDVNLSQKIFLIIGVGAKGELFLKIDCLRKNRASSDILSNEEVDNFEDLLLLKENEYDAFIIKKNEIENYNWDYLILRTKKYLEDYKDLYYFLEKNVGIKANVNIDENSIELVDTPDKIISKLGFSNNFIGYKTDWLERNKQRKRLGNLGEKLILKYERDKNPNKANQINIEEDGKGYDIISFDNNSNKIYIEVKTTCNNIDEPFFLSRNEYEFIKHNKENYYVYRLFNYRYDMNNGKLFVMNGREFLDKAILSPTNFEISLNQK